MRTSDRADLIGFVPYVLGFQPIDSLVLMAMRRKHIAFTGRMDIDAGVEQTIAEFRRSLGRVKGITGLFLFAYTGPSLVDSHVKPIADRLARLGYPVWETLRVSDGRYHCLKCTTCMPPDGVPLDLTATAGAALGTYLGRVVLPDRDSVLRQVNPIGGIAAIAMSQATDRAEDRLAHLLADASEPAGALCRAGESAVDDALARAATGVQLADDEAAWLVLLLHHLPVRDRAWVGTDKEDWQLRFWLDLTRRGEPALIAPVATLLGWCSWRRGDCVLAEAAVARALRVEPAYGLALTLLDALQAGMPPSSANGWVREFGTARKGRHRAQAH